MRGKIFKSTFFTSMLVLAVSFLMIFGALWNFFEEQIFSELESEAEYVAYGMENDIGGFLENFDDEEKRITVISSGGEVLYDTMADASELENHSDRKEIKEAAENGSGKSTRYSNTLTEKTLYYAKRLENGNILRVCATQASVFVILLSLLKQIILIAAIALAISMLISYRVSNKILKPINAIDPEKPEEADTYEEIAPLLKKMLAQKRTIKQQLEEAEKSREEFKLICENMNEGFLVIDNRARVFSYNDAALKLLKIDDIKNDNVLVLNRTKGFRELVEKALCGERAESMLEIEESTYNLIANPVYQADKIIGAVIVIIDVTESARREQLRREFTSNVSHELKTPLTSISGFAEMMKEGGIPEETVMDFSSSVYDEAQRLIGLVSDIMKISELDEGGVMYACESVDLFALSEEIAERLASECKKNNITLNVKGERACVFGARKILDEMIYNLCDNAIKYNRPNGSVEVCVSENDGAVRLSVSDTGIGIPQNELTRVFERFYRVDKSRSRSVGGTGLGLAIVKHGAMYHNAETEIESTEDVGTKISLIFKKIR